MLCETDLELEGACLATKPSLWDSGRGEIEDLEWANAKPKQTVHGFLVVGTHDAYFCDRTEEGSTQSRHCWMDVCDDLLVNFSVRIR